MKRVILSLVFVLGFYGCSTQARYIVGGEEYVSAGLDLRDIKNTVQVSLDSLFRSGYFQKIQTPVVVVVSDFVNDTTSKLDMEQITARIVEEMLNSGKFKVTRAYGGSGGTSEKMVRKSRELQNDAIMNQESVMGNGEVIAASASLSGKVGQRITRVGGDQRVDFFFKVEIVDNKTGLVEWSNTQDISKIASGNQSVW